MVSIFKRYPVVLLGIVLLAAPALRAQVPPASAPSVDVPLDPSTDPPQTQLSPVLREYDRFQDKTALRVEGIRPTITRGSSRLFLTAVCSFDGAAPTTRPTKVQLEVLAVSDTFQFAEMKDDLQLIFLIHDRAPATPVAPAIPNLGLQPAPSPVAPPVDFRRVRIPARFEKAGATRDASHRSLESFVAIIDADLLTQMATAPHVEGQLGGSEFTLGTIEQLSLRRFAENVDLLPPTDLVKQQPVSTMPSVVRADAVTVHLAQARVDAAQESVDRLTAACLSKLMETREYQTAALAVADLESRKEQAPAGSQRAAVSQEWLEARAKVALMRSSALLEDDALAAAKRDLADAEGKLRSLQRLADAAHPSGLAR